MRAYICHLSVVRAGEHVDSKSDSLDQDDEEKHHFPQSQPVVSGLSIAFILRRALFQGGRVV